MQDVAAETASRVSFMLRAIYGNCVDQRASRDLDVDPRTVKGWLSGQIPNGTHLAKMARHYGASFRDFVFAPPTWADDAALEARIYAIHVKADMLKAEINQERTGAREGCENG